MAENIFWLGHASVKITGEKTVYIDPWKIKETEKADIILITHSHFDHFSIEDIKKIRTEKTEILAPADCKAKMPEIQAVAPGQKLTIQNISIETVPSYNINKKFHPKENHWNGYIITINRKRVYIAGDTDKIPEMAAIKNIDIACLPVSGTYVMSAEEAAEAAKIIKPKIAIPIHYGDIVGTSADAERFRKLCNCMVEIPEVTR